MTATTHTNGGKRDLAFVALTTTHTYTLTTPHSDHVFVTSLENVGLFCQDLGLFFQNVSLFCQNVGLFCQQNTLTRPLLRHTHKGREIKPLCFFQAAARKS
mmetsp:Transcript_84780/g.137485  ORF Transcript_84780/g.137485 Transcript_84780/m.137485 type:complete len:101 (+) Transcript_84780:76-378(+)